MLKPILFRLLTIGCGLFIAILFLELVLRCLPVISPMGPLAVNMEHPLIHLPPNHTFHYSTGWNFAIQNTARTNNEGFVNDQPYHRERTGPLLVVIGDSFVEALQVPYVDTLHGRLAARIRGQGEVYSLGFSGAQLAQYAAMARWAQVAFHPTAYVFVIVMNDFDESLLAYKQAAGFWHFADEEGTLTLRLLPYTPSLVKRTARRYSALARYLNHHLNVGELVRQYTTRGPRATMYVGYTDATPAPQRVADSQQAIVAFFRELSIMGLQPGQVLFVLDALRPAIYTEMLAQVQGSYAARMHEAFLAACQERGYEVVDLQQHFLARYRQEGVRFEFPTDGHWNSLGHAVAAQAVADTQMFREMFRQGN